MSNIVQSVGTMVGAGVKGLMEMAEGYIYDDDNPDIDNPDIESHLPPPSPPSRSPRHDETHSTHSNPSLSSSLASSHSATSSLPPTDNLVQIVDVPSGWIHIPAAYVYAEEAGGTGQRTIKSFGLKNLVGKEVRVEVASDMREQVSFWLNEDEGPIDSGVSSASSTSSTPSPALSTILAPDSSCVVHIAFQPSAPSDSGSFQAALDQIDQTPRVHPAHPRHPVHDSLISPPPSISAVSRGGSHDGSSYSVSGSIKSSAYSGGGRKQEPIHRAFSVHGLITIRASTLLDVVSDSESPASTTTLISRQTINLPLFATVCKSLFTAALIDPASGRTCGSHLSSGRLEVDFGPDSVVGGQYHRDILLVNRSEVELVWATAVVNARNKDAVWFSLRDLDSENVFGVDTSAQPVPLPPLSSRHLRLELRVRQPLAEFDFDFILSNVNQPGNVVTCHAVGSGVAEASDSALKILSETHVNFGEVCDGVWSRRVVTCKNTGDKPLDVRFSATPGHEVVFRLAGVAGDDMDEDLPIGSMRHVRSSHGSGSEKRGTSIEPRRGRDMSSSRKSSRGASPASSIGRESSSVGDEGSPSLSAQLHADLSRHLGALDGPIAVSRSLPAESDKASSGGRDPSQPPSRGLSRVTSRTSSYLHHTSAESDEDDDLDSKFLSSDLSTSPSMETPSLAEVADKAMPNQIEELTMRPGTEYRILLLYRPARDTFNPPEIAGALRESSFRVYLDSTSSSRSSPSRRTLKCSAKSCTSLISITSGGKIDFGEVTVGASKTATISISNLSALSARVEIAAISKVLSANRNVIVIPPFESVEERIEFFPRRINEKYEKQIFVRNLLNRANDQLLEIRSKNVDVYNLTIHSHLYRILTPSGSNFLDFGSVIINSPTIRTVYFENLTSAPLLLELMASQPEDVELFVKAEDAPPAIRLGPGKYAETGPIERVQSPPNGELKERFMETMRELSVKAETGQTVKSSKGKAKTREKNETKAGEEAPKLSIGASMAAALKKGSRGKPVQLYGNAVVYKDRSLLEDHEYLDLAAGPPVAAHRISPRSKRAQLLDTIEWEDKSKLSGQHPRVPKLDFAACAKATGLFSKDSRVKRSKTSAGTAPKSPSSAFTTTPARQSAPINTLTKTNGASGEPAPSLASVVSAMASLSPSGSAKSPALTARRIEPRDVTAGSDVSKMTVDELLVAIEQQDSQKSSITHSSLEEEEAYVKRHMSLRKELQNLVNSGKLVPARALSVTARATCKLIVIMTPNGSTRPHVSTKAKRADSRIFIKLADFDRSLLSQAAGSSTELGDLPVRDLVIRSSCVRSVLEVGQTSINFGSCEKGEVKSKTIVVQNKSDCIGMFRLRTSGSIASGDLKLGRGRYGVIAAFGRKEVEQFSFTPSLTGNYQETLTVENVLDTYNDQKVAVKAVVRKHPAMTVDTTMLDLGSIHPDAPSEGKDRSPDLPGFVVTNVSKHERTFVVTVDADATADGIPGAGAFAEVSLIRDEKGGGMALSKGEEEEVETILQKLKIARRKGKADKIKKYETRLEELGVSQPGAAKEDSDAESVTGDGHSAAHSALGSPVDEVPPSIPVPIGQEMDLARKECVRSLSITLGPNQKTKILVDLIMTGKTGELATNITLHDRKNMDETVRIGVKATLGSKDEAEAAPAIPCPSEQPLHQSIMRHCLKLTLQCPVSQTAFCVGSSLFLPDTSPFFAVLRPFFPVFPPEDPDPIGLILADGYSRQIPGNTHAEANALANFRAKYAELVKTSIASSPNVSSSSASTMATSASTTGSSVASESLGTLPPVEDVLRDTDCYATMEPCSMRTSGGPSCALELVRAHVKRVYLGVEEPPDFVQCEGVRILEQGGVEVRRVGGLEEECLKAARRGRS